MSEDPAAGTLTRRIVTFVRRRGAFRRAEEHHVIHVPRREAIVTMLRDTGFTVRTTRWYGQQPLAPRRVAFIARRAR
ncbi:MAG: hypothetical protein AB7O67_08465 [Vicinamibacterales bacterium]